MDSKKIIAEAMKELKAADVYEEMAAESRCKARKLLESVYSPAPSGAKNKGLSQAEILNLKSRRRMSVKHRRSTMI